MFFEFSNLDYKQQILVSNPTIIKSKVFITAQCSPFADSARGQVLPSSYMGKLVCYDESMETLERFEHAKAIIEMERGSKSSQLNLGGMGESIGRNNSSGSDNGNFDGGSDNGGDLDLHRLGQRRGYKRHSAQQIHELEIFYLNCCYPNETQRLELSYHLNLEPHKVKNWFKNRRARTKRVQGGPLLNMIRSFNLAGEVSNSFAHETVAAISTSNNGSVGVDEILGKSILQLATAAMEELMRMAQMGEPLWMEDRENGREMLNVEEYRRRFVRCIGPKPDEYVAEASRESGVVIVDSMQLVERLMDADCWAAMFPCLIGETTTTDVICSGMGGTRNGALQLMQASVKVVSPLVPTREMNFLRFCKQHRDGIWAIVDVSSDGIRGCSSAPNENTSFQKLPSGCMLHDMPNGSCKVTWVEHCEYDESSVDKLYRPLLKSGLGLGAQRWLACLQHECELPGVVMPSSVASNDLTGMTSNGERSPQPDNKHLAEGKRCS